MTPAAQLIIDATRAGVLLVAEGQRLTYRAADTLPPDLANRLKAHRDDVLELLRNDEPANPYRRPAVEGGAPQSVLDTLGDLFDREPQDADEHRAIWEEATGRDVFGGPSGPPNPEAPGGGKGA